MMKLTTFVIKFNLNFLLTKYQGYIKKERDNMNIHENLAKLNYNPISAKTRAYPCRVRALNEEADGRSRAETPRRKRRRHRPLAGS